MYYSLQNFIDTLDKKEELIRIKEFVNPKLEITEIVDRVSKSEKQNKALLFENTGYSFPLLINALGSEERICLALGVQDLNDIQREIEGLFKTLASPKNNLFDKLKMLPELGKVAAWMPKMIKKQGACQEVVLTGSAANLNILPVLTCWKYDGGPFITLPLIHTICPHTNIRNIGMYRMQVFEPKLAALHWHKHKVSAGHFNSYKKLNQIMPVAVALGGDPVYTYCATAPLPPNIDEYMLAGFLRKKQVELVPCITQPNMYVPADADIIIEGYVDPNEELIWEGPFGDHTGYYSLPDWYPRFHVTAITHKKNAIYPATIVGIPPQEDAWIGKATERIFLAPIKMTMLPEILDMELPIYGVFHNLTIVKIQKQFSGHAQKVMNAMWGAGQMMFNKILIVVDEKAPALDNYLELAAYVCQNLDVEADMFFGSGPMDVLDHSCAKFAFGGKLCIDGTHKTLEELRLETTDTSDNANPLYLQINLSLLQAQFAEIKSINTQLLQNKIPIIALGIKKNQKKHVEHLNQQLFALEVFKEIKMIVYIEYNVPIDNWGDIIWSFANNIDPRRDNYLIKSTDDNPISHIGLDGTRKTAEFDNFNREWPNIIISEEDTIKAIDEKWERLGLGKFIPSPSLRYKSMLYKGGAVAID